ncbi:MAG: hypothetical protein J5685_04400 [Clostridiales bacterium]|nr:hypothetical protein [Clostridiales bacterium]
MKKTADKKEPKKSLFRFGSSKKDEFEYTTPDRGIRHLEDAASFLNEDYSAGGQFGQPEDMQDRWGLSKNDAFVKRRKRRVFLRFGIALAVTVLIITSVFYFLPRILPGFFKGSNIELFVEKNVVYEYGDSYRVVKETVAKIMEQPIVSSECTTQVLFNEPVRLLAPDVGNGYDLIETMDGITGYIRSSALTPDMTSVEPDLHEYKLVVSDAKKNIMSHASHGTLVTEVMMNTVLYADVKRDGVYQVSLPDGDTGWIGSSGVIEIGPRDQIEAVSTRYFVSSALTLVNAMYSENGISAKGISINGLVYVCSSVNGIPMPRLAEDQILEGTEVELQYDVVTGELLTDQIIPGDILFLASPYDPDSTEIYEMAVCTDSGTLLKVSSSGTTIRLVRFDSESELCNRIIAVRRVFTE